MGKTKKTKRTGDLQMVYTSGKKKNSSAAAVCQAGKGTITVNRVPIQNIEPKTLRIKIFEPLLILGANNFAGLKIRVRVRGGGQVAQLYAARMAIAKAIVAWKQKYEDEEEKVNCRRTLLSYDKGLLVADPRRREPKKYGGSGARARRQKSYR